jgi:hypothetical protein
MKSTINHLFLIIFYFSTYLFSCKTNENKHLYQKWKSVSLQNNKMDDEIKKMQDYIDTVGNLDKEIGKATDIHLLKAELKADMEKGIAEQKQALENTLMEFTQNNMMISTSIDGVDSVMFEIEENTIKLDDAKLKGYGESMTFTILKLSKDSLRLQLVDYGDTSIINMIPTK